MSCEKSLLRHHCARIWENELTIVTILMARWYFWDFLTVILTTVAILMLTSGMTRTDAICTLDAALRPARKSCVTTI